MGAYLSTPNREKDSVDFCSDGFSYGASSMQGWRISQEDAHNCCPEFDKENNSVLFAVYDGHGGAEVAQYTAQHFPDFLKSMPKYKEGAVAQALEDAFLAFDETLTKDHVITTLKELAGVDEAEEDEEEQKDEMAGLREEAEMPLDKLMERYGAANRTMDALRGKGDDFRSPALRAKTTSCDKTEAEHIKQNMSNKILNGDHDEVGEHVTNGDSCKKDTDSPSKKSAEEIKKENKANADIKLDVSEVNKKDITLKPEGASNGPKSPSDTVPDSTQTEDTSDKKTTDTTSEDVGKNEATAKSDDSLKTAEVSSSTECTKKHIVGSSSITESSSIGGSSVGGSSEGASSAGGSTEGGSSAGGSSAGGSSGSGSSTAETEKAEEPTSSSGRRRSKKSGVIPEEGEDESSFDEDEETTDEEDDLDEEDITESDSEDEDMAGFEGMEDEEGEEDGEEDIVYGGEEPGSDSGCTAVVAVLKDKELFVANAGDSRCIVCRNGKAIDMSIDHKPEDELERTRIEKAGGQVTEDNRVNGGLNLSRAIGDHVYKKNADLPLKEQMITPLPDVKSLTLTDEDEFLVLACDGIWNVMSSQDVCVFVRDRLKAGVEKLSTIIEEMFDFCIAPDTNGDGTGCDNMTCIIVKLKHKQVAQGAAKRRASQDSEQQQETKKSKDAAD